MSRPKPPTHKIIWRDDAGDGECAVCGPTDLVWYKNENYPRCGTNIRNRTHNRTHGSRSTFKDGHPRPTRAEVAQMVEDQGGKCAICEELFGTEYHIDHCHSTGQVRGLLCRGCNLGLGFFRDNGWRLARAINYLG